MKKIVLALTFVLVGSFMLAGCSKDEILDHYNNIVQSAGAIELTGKSSLEGTKEKAVTEQVHFHTPMNLRLCFGENGHTLSCEPHNLSFSTVAFLRHSQNHFLSAPLQQAAS